jgi:hypothetical protein
MIVQAIRRETGCSRAAAYRAVSDAPGVGGVRPIDARLLRPWLRINRVLLVMLHTR